VAQVGLQIPLLSNTLLYFEISFVFDWSLKPIKHKLDSLQNINFHKRWITFTYFGPQIRSVTNLFKHPNLRIVLLTPSTVTSLKQRHQKIVMYGTIQPLLAPQTI